MKLTITLSWPESALWPNSRPHWSARARATREARLEGRLVTAAALAGRYYYWPAPTGREVVHLTIIGHKPNARRRDASNLQSALKAAVDGIVDAIGVDDEFFELTTRWGENRPPRGCVVVTIG